MSFTDTFAPRHPWHPGTWVTGQSAGQVLGEGWVDRAGSVFELSAGIVFANMVRYINGLALNKLFHLS